MLDFFPIENSFSWLDACSMPDLPSVAIQQLARQNQPIFNDDISLNPFFVILELQMTFSHQYFVFLIRR